MRRCYLVYFSVISQAKSLAFPPLKPIKDIITGTGSRYTKIHGVLGNACQDQRAPSKQEAIASDGASHHDGVRNCCQGYYYGSSNRCSWKVA